MFYNIRRHLRKVGVTGHNDIEHLLKIFEITGRTNEIKGLAASLTQNEFDNCINISNIFGLTDIPSANEVKFELFGVISRKDKIVSKDRVYKFVRKLLVLPFLPAKHIPTTLEDIATNAKSTRTKELATHVKKHLAFIHRLACTILEHIHETRQDKQRRRGLVQTYQRQGGRVKQTIQ
ncbi:unnamed protein product [Mytilus edulis]|uniref:Uncharacterized protein n=1 Tax=Mytilus edulis TaxID=6550 RepID=A0A8S3RXD0_MYTED|nr:unnamed protein product [Mytilus edulis]